MKGKLVVCVALLAVILVTGLIFGQTNVNAEKVEMVVIASQLNGRAFPTTKSSKETFYNYGERVTSTGAWSSDHKWIEVIGGEGGTVWCKAEYLTERTDTFVASNEGRKSVKIRRSPIDGKVVGYLKAGKTLKISQVILGWGKCKSGWIDLGYLCEVVEGE